MSFCSVFLVPHHLSLSLFAWMTALSLLVGAFSFVSSCKFLLPSLIFPISSFFPRISHQPQLNDLVASRTVEIGPSGDLVADPGGGGGEGGRARVTVCLMPNVEEVTAFEQTGEVTMEGLKEASAFCKEGCKALHGRMREALLCSGP